MIPTEKPWLAFFLHGVQESPPIADRRDATMHLKKLANDHLGSIVISVILGLGLAALFQRVCTGDSCVVIKAPSLADVRKYTYKLDQSCYKYTPEVVPCPLKRGNVAPADEVV